MYFKQVVETWMLQNIRLYHPLDGITHPKYKLCFLTTKTFLQREEGTIF